MQSSHHHGWNTRWENSTAKSGGISILLENSHKTDNQRSCMSWNFLLGTFWYSGCQIHSPHHHGWYLMQETSLVTSAWKSFLREYSHNFRVSRKTFLLQRFGTRNIKFNHLITIVDILGGKIHCSNPVENTSLLKTITKKKDNLISISKRNFFAATCWYFGYRIKLNQHGWHLRFQCSLVLSNGKSILLETSHKTDTLNPYVLVLGISKQTQYHHGSHLTLKKSPIMENPSC